MNQLELPGYIFLDEDGKQLDFRNFETVQEAFEHAKTLDTSVVDIALWLGFVDNSGKGKSRIYTFTRGLNDFSPTARSNSPKS